MTLKEEIENCYTKKTLVALYKVYFKKWIENEWVVLPESSPLSFNADLLQGDGIQKITAIDYKKVTNLKKQYFIPILEQFYTNENTFKKIFASLDENVKMLFTRVAFEGRVDINSVEIDVIENEIYGEVVIKDEYKLLESVIYYHEWQDQYSGDFSLGKKILQRVKSILPKPENYYLHATQFNSSVILVDFEKEAISNLHKYRDFCSTQLKYGKNGKVLKTSYKKMQESLNISEFYKGDKDLGFLRSELLAVFFGDIKDKYDENLSNAMYLREVFSSFQTDNSIELALFDRLESHIKGGSTYFERTTDSQNIFSTLCNVFEECPDGELASMENILDFIRYRDLPFELRSSYYNCSVTVEETFKQKVRIDRANYNIFVTRPLCEGLLFLCGSLGLVKAAYVNPTGVWSAFKNGYLNTYDGLAGIELTDLGAYVFGVVDAYEEPEIIKSEGSITLNETKHIISLKGNDALLQFSVDALAKKRTATLYQFDYETLYKGVGSAKEVSEKFNILFKHVEGEIPKNWKNLQEEVTKRLNPLKNRTTYTVLELNKDIELLKILASDESLKKLIIKAENYMIVAKKNDVSIIKQRLRKYGYFFENK